MSEQNQNQSPEKAPLETSFSGRTPKEGDIVVGKIVKLTDSVVFIDFGARSQGYIRLAEFKDENGVVIINEGDEIPAKILSARGAIELSYKQAQQGQALVALRDAWKSQTAVKGRIVNVNKGGYEIRINGVRAFCPNSQLAAHFVDEPAREVGNEYEFMITEFGDGKSLVVSRRVLIDAQRAAMRDTLNDRVRVGDRLQGTVTRLQDFGAFVDLGDGVEGLLHVSEISHERINSPSEKLSVGEAVEVEIIRVEAEKGRVALSMRRLQSDPWTDFVAANPVGSIVTGNVVKLQDFGAFVSVAPGVEGLLHVSAISAEKRINHPDEVLTGGEEIQVVIEKIEADRRRIGLLTPEVAEARKPVEMNAKVGDVVKGLVTRVEKYGVFLEFEPKVVGLIPNGEMLTDRGADHRRMFPVGTELEVKILEVERNRNRIRLSRKALKDNDEKEAMREYREKHVTPNSLGSFGDLLKNFLNEDE
jgi:small subunit ribosomal protein S1